MLIVLQSRKANSTEQATIGISFKLNASVFLVKKVILALNINAKRRMGCLPYLFPNCKHANK